MLKLSIITINLNNVEGLRKTMKSVVSQTFKNMEWIVIDGGSTDGSKELIEKNSSYITHWISEKDNGIYNALNKGIGFAKGDYLLFLNSGDYLSEDSILEQVFCGIGLSADLCFGYTWYVKDGIKSLMGTHKEDFTLFQFLTGPIPHSGGTFYRRKLFLDYGLYDEKFYLCGDADFNIRVIFKYRCSIQKLELYLSYFDGNGLSQHPNKDIGWETHYMIDNNLLRVFGSDFKEFPNLKDRRHALLIWDTINKHWVLKTIYKLFIHPFFRH